MALFQKLSRKLSRPNGSKISTTDIKTDWKKPLFTDKAVRLVVFTDNDIKGRKLIFDSKGIIKEEEQSSWSRCRVRLQQNCSPKPCPPKYQSKRTGSEGKMLEEMMFGAVGVAYKGTSLKVHVIRNPPQLMLTKVFAPDIPKRSSVSDLDDSNSLSSQTDLTGPKPVSQESKNSPMSGKSIPMDVPSPGSNWAMRSIDVIDEDSGLASMTSSGSFQMAHPSPSSYTGSCNSLSRERRVNRGKMLSLESCGRRRSHADLSQSQEGTTGAGAPTRPKKIKIAIGILFGTIDESSEGANRLFEEFFFSHIALFESHLERLRLSIVEGYDTGKYSSFLTIVIEAYDCFKLEIQDLYVAPRLSEPVWLNMMAYSSYRYVLCEKFLQEFMSLVGKYDNKANNFFISTLVTAVLTHHLAWVPTVTPAGGTPSKTYVDKHSAKWVDTLAKQHPYNPLWAQLGDLYGAIGFPLKLSRTIVVGKKADLVKKLLYVLSYFIRCSDILQMTDTGCLTTCLESVNFTETPIETERGFASEMPTPTQQPEVPMEFIAQCSNLKCSESEKTIATSENDLIIDSHTGDSQQNPSSNQPCSSCVANRMCSSDTSRSVYGKSVFYVPNVCHCDKNKQTGDKPNPVDRANLNLGQTSGEHQNGPLAKSRPNLKLDIPSMESLRLQSLESDDSHGHSLSECRLSYADIVEDAKIARAQHVRREIDSAMHSSSSLPVLSAVVKNGSSLDVEENRKTVKQSHGEATDNVGRERVLSKSEIQSIYLKEGSNSEFNEYFEEGIEAKTIDDIDEKDRLVDLPGKHKQRYLSGDSQHREEIEGASKAPSLPDLSQVKGESGQVKTPDGRLPRERLGSLDHTRVRNRKSFSRKISEEGSSRPNLAPIRCRPVTPTELRRRRHLSSTGSYDFDFVDPRAFCRELPMPDVMDEATLTSQKTANKNFGRSLLADYSDHYLSDFVLQGTSDRQYMGKLVQDMRMATQYSVLDEPIAEAVCVIADTDNWSVNVCSSQHLDKPRHGLKPCEFSPLVSNLIESVVHLWKLKMSPEFCIMHLEDRLQEILFKSKMLAEYLKGSKKSFDMKSLSAIFGFETSDLPLLAAIAGTHSPHLSLCVV